MSKTLTWGWLLALVVQELELVHWPHQVDSFEDYLVLNGSLHCRCNMQTGHRQPRECRGCVVYHASAQLKM